MIQDVETLLNSYRRWLEDETQVRQVAEWVEITTPYLDRHNDFLQIYVKRDGDGYLLSDDAYTIEDLELSGCDLGSERRHRLLETTLNGFGVSLNGETRALETHASDGDFALRKHGLVQAMLAVNDLFVLAAPIVTNVFLEEVTAWLDNFNIRYTTSVMFAGKSGFGHRFDFVIPHSIELPERIVRVVNNPNRDRVQSVTFAWLDTQHARPSDSRAYAILNDSGQKVSEQVHWALSSYGVTPLAWTTRDESVDELVR